MDFLKDLFGDGSLSFNELSQKAKEKGLNVADLSKGGYVGVEKFTKAETDLKKSKKDYTELAKSIDGDDGLKKQIGKLEESNTDLTGKLSKATGDLSHFQNSSAALKAGINPKMLDYVTFEVGKLVNDTMDFGKALEGFVAQNPQFAGEEDSQNTKVNSSHRMSGGGDGVTNTNEKMNNALLTLAGKK